MNGLESLHVICQNRGWSMGLRAEASKVHGLDVFAIVRLEVYDRKIKDKGSRLVTGIPVVAGDVATAATVLAELI